MLSTQKAILAEVQIGNTTVEGFQLPNGQYLLSVKQATELIGIRSYRFSQICATEEAQSLIGSGLDLSHFSPIKFNSSYAKHSGCTLAQVMFMDENWL